MRNENPTPNPTIDTQAPPWRINGPLLQTIIENSLPGHTINVTPDKNRHGSEAHLLKIDGNLYILPVTAYQPVWTQTSIQTGLIPVS